MGVIQKLVGGSGRYEADMGTAFLPRCWKCGSPHPLAIKGRKDIFHCVNPDCNEPPAAPQYGFAKAVLNVPPFIAFFANLFGEAGHRLKELARKVDPDAD